MQHRAFTLIELLVVISIIAVLLSLLMPALGMVNESSRITQCKQNQRTIFMGFVSVIDEFDGRTPKIHDSSKDLPFMFEFTYAAFPQAERLDSRDPQGHTTWNVCPEIDNSFRSRKGRPAYAGLNIGFGSNPRRRPGFGLGDSDGFRWEQVRNPSVYPWFADPRIAETPTGAVVPHSFGQKQDEDGQWFVGRYHNDGESGVAVFADGHTEDTKASDLDGVDLTGVPLWLLDADW